MKFNSEGLKNITGIYGPSGHEEKVVAYIQEEIKDYVDEISVDSLGNLIARKKGQGPKVMIAGHMDQIGLMITDVDDKGFVRFTNVGGIMVEVTIGQRFEFADGRIGIVGKEEKQEIQKTRLEHLYLDIGAKNKEEAEKWVSIGDICVYYSEYYETEHTAMARCMDDRIGCFVMIEALKRLGKVENDCYFVFTVQEEVGTRGAKTSAYSIEPDIGLAVDITLSGDTPEARRFAVSLHDGVAIKVRDNSLLSHPKVNDRLIALCEDNKIKYQMEVLEFGGTDAGAMSLTKEGVPASCLSIPTRYGHSDHEVISKADVEAAIQLLVQSLERPFEI
jgi:endoglucanase